MKIQEFICFLKHTVSYLSRIANVKMIIKKGTFLREYSQYLFRKMVYQSISVGNLTATAPLYSMETTAVLFHYCQEHKSKVYLCPVFFHSHNGLFCCQ